MLVVRTHGGELWAEDSEDGGTSFCFTLPETLKELIS
jgi:signal transduction histidine kinase